MRIIGIGDLVIDCYIRNKKIVGYNGGKTFTNILANLSKYNYLLEVMGAVGNDQSGNLCIKSLKELNIETKNINIVNEETRCFFIDEKNSTRTSPIDGRKVGYRGTKIDTDIIIKNIKQDDILVFDNLHTKTLQIINNCSNNKMIDIGYYKDFIDKNKEDIIEMIGNKFNIINMNVNVFDFISRQLNINELELYKILNVELLLITKGKKGVSFIYNNKCINKELEIISKEVDVNGAGDSFFAEVINIYIKYNFKLNDSIIEEMFNKGSFYSRKVITKIGARSNVQELYKIVK